MINSQKIRKIQRKCEQTSEFIIFGRNNMEFNSFFFDFSRKKEKKVESRKKKKEIKIISK
jgi:hypothetical protein